MDLFLAAAYHDEDFTIGLKNSLSGRGLVVGELSSLRRRRRLFPPIERALSGAASPSSTSC